MPEKALFQQHLQVIHHQRLMDHGLLPKNVLTEKMGLFWVVLPAKQGFRAGKKTSFFALFHVLVVFCVYKLLTCKIFRQFRAAKKNRAEKPTVGFCFLGASGNMVA